MKFKMISRKFQCTALPQAWLVKGAGFFSSITAQEIFKAIDGMNIRDKEAYFNVYVMQHLY